MTDLSRGEIDVVVNGQAVPLCLTLDALAELEEKGTFQNLNNAFAQVPSLSTQDATNVVLAGLRGGGNIISDDEFAQIIIEGGLTKVEEIAYKLLHATFIMPYKG